MADASVTLKLNSGPFIAGIRRAQGGLKSFGSMAMGGGFRAGIVGAKGLSLAAVSAATGLAYGAKRAYDLGGSLNDMSAKTGIAADQLLILQQAAKDAGIEDVSGAVAKMQRNLVEAVKNGASPAGKALRLLGLSGGALIKKLPVEQLAAIGEKIAAIQSPAVKTAMAMEIFGKSGAELIPLFESGGALEGAARVVGRQAGILRENAKAFDDVSDRLGHAGTKLQGFFVGVAKGMLPAMDATSKRFEDLDLSGEGERFGAALVASGKQFAEIFGRTDMVGVAQLFSEKLVSGAASVAKMIGMFKPFIASTKKELEAIAGLFGKPKHRMDEVVVTAKRPEKKRSSFWQTADPREGGLFGTQFQGPLRPGEKLGNSTLDIFKSKPSNFLESSYLPGRANMGGAKSGLTSGGLTSGGMGGAYGKISRGDARAASGKGETKAIEDKLDKVNEKLEKQLKIWEGS